MNVKRATLWVHPFVYAYMTKGFISLRCKMRFRYWFRLNILPDQNMPYLQYRFTDKDGNEIDVVDNNG